MVKLKGLNPALLPLPQVTLKGEKMLCFLHIPIKITQLLSGLTDKLFLQGMLHLYLTAYCKLMRRRMTVNSNCCSVYESPQAGAIISIGLLDISDLS